MARRAPLVIGALLGGAGLLAVGLVAGWSPALVAVVAVLGLLGGAALGQGLAWVRGTAGSARRLESAAERERTTSARAQDVLRADLGEARGSIAGSIAELRAHVERLERTVTELESSQRSSAERTAESTKAAVESARANLRTRMEELAHRQSVERRQVRALSAERTSSQTALLEAFLQLQRLVPMPMPMPKPGRWAASEDLLLWLVGDVLERRPRVVLDLGSGQSSVWMAGAMRAAGYDGTVVAVDHDPVYAAATEELGRRQGVQAWLRVVCAPLVDMSVTGRDVAWYDLTMLDGVEEIGLVCVDGPPGVDVSWARWPALPLLRDRLAPAARIVLDDMVREDEQAIAADWQERYPDLVAERLDFDKGALVFTAP